MAIAAIAADEPGRPRSPFDFADGLAALAKAQGVQPRPDLDGWDGWIQVNECVGPAFGAAPLRAEVN